MIKWLNTRGQKFSRTPAHISSWTTPDKTQISDSLLTQRHSALLTTTDLKSVSTQRLCSADCRIFLRLLLNLLAHTHTHTHTHTHLLWLSVKGPESVSQLLLLLLPLLLLRSLETFTPSHVNSRLGSGAALAPPTDAHLFNDDLTGDGPGRGNNGSDLNPNSAGHRCLWRDHVQINNWDETSGE